MYMTLSAIMSMIYNIVVFIDHENRTKAYRPCDYGLRNAQPEAAADHRPSQPTWTVCVTESACRLLSSTATTAIQ